MKNLGENMAKFKECIICVRRLGDLLENSEFLHRPFLTNVSE